MRDRRPGTTSRHNKKAAGSLIMLRKTDKGGALDRRNYPRVSARLPVRLQTGCGAWIPCTVIDASISGVRLETEIELEIGAEVTLIMPGSVHCGGRVVRLEKGTLGVEFSHAPERVAEMISDLLPGLQAHSNLKTAT
ncbi:PilZ domain-containing protein [Denitrobaculum tricleocarpae]|uniref:PilZ domain-containing protein n=2 Tax=Denitrobaculum tricleocarpae TaxID=2591009 RepID=A0A545TP08_9PROT|nr:PilZ domain-containing protein [Denitrobaculum tricleocarpae]